MASQYFTVRDPRFAQALATVPGVCKPWSANTVRVLDTHGRVTEAPLPARESHWVPVPGMNELANRWARPLIAATQVELKTRVIRIEPDALEPKGWQLRTEAGDARHVYGGFDGVLLALPAPQAADLLESSALSPKGSSRLAGVDVAPCWTLMLAFPNAMQPGLGTLGPQWNAARSTHHRIAWLARESSKPGREPMERWTVQASATWSREHLQDDPARVEAKMLKAFAEVTGICATPAHTAVHRWRFAQTLKPLGQSHLWDARPASAPAATGASGTASKTRLCRGWNWRWPQCEPSGERGGHRAAAGPPQGGELPRGQRTTRAGAWGPSSRRRAAPRRQPPWGAANHAQRGAWGPSPTGAASRPRPPARCTRAPWSRRWPAGWTPARRGGNGWFASRTWTRHGVCPAPMP